MLCTDHVLSKPVLILGKSMFDFITKRFMTQNVAWALDDYDVRQENKEKELLRKSQNLRQYFIDATRAQIK